MAFFIGFIFGSLFGLFAAALCIALSDKENK